MSSSPNSNTPTHSVSRRPLLDLFMSYSGFRDAGCPPNAPKPPQPFAPSASSPNNSSSSSTRTHESHPPRCPPKVIIDLRIHRKFLFLTDIASYDIHIAFGSTVYGRELVRSTLKMFPARSSQVTYSTRHCALLSTPPIRPSSAGGCARLITTIYYI
jgi:hypothetical protein